MTLRLKANRRFPSVPVVTDNLKNHTQVLMSVKEALDIGQRRTGDLLNSFIRVEDLIDLGLITIEGNTNAIVGADLSEIADIGDLSGAAAGDFLRFDGTEWINDTLVPSDITQVMVTQHQAALSIAYSQLTGAPTVEVVRAATFTAGLAAIVTPAPQIALFFPVAKTIRRVTLLTLGGTGSCVVDIWKAAYAAYPPTIADTITAAAKPTISSGVKYDDATLTGWDVDIAAGDTLIFNLDSSSVFTSIFVFLDLEPA